MCMSSIIHQRCGLDESTSTSVFAAKYPCLNTGRANERDTAYEGFMDIAWPYLLDNVYRRSSLSIKRTRHDSERAS